MLQVCFWSFYVGRWLPYVKWSSVYCITLQYSLLIGIPPERHCWQLHSHWRDADHIDFRHAVFETVALARFMPLCLQKKYWYMVKVLVIYYAGIEIVIEFLDLFLYVPEEGVARHPSYQHYSIDGYFIEVHGHGGA